MDGLLLLLVVVALALPIIAIVALALAIGAQGRVEALERRVTAPERERAQAPTPERAPLLHRARPGAGRDRAISISACFSAPPVATILP